MSKPFSAISLYDLYPITLFIHNLNYNLFFWTETSKRPFAFRFFFNSIQMTELCETRIRNKTSSMLEHCVYLRDTIKYNCFIVSSHFI